MLSGTKVLSSVGDRLLNAEGELTPSDPAKTACRCGEANVQTGTSAGAPRGGGRRGGMFAALFFLLVSTFHNEVLKSQPLT